ncbi:MAG: hypothetical protein CMC21_01065 [Flavobacteriaceae bacterium]|nr:hypothetical protein [Flavobacteriaceae bacterium]|tara:strand:- start:4557 stop:5252 length:696 start_codon:yes stop_codon:yes gene_type:complete
MKFLREFLMLFLAISLGFFVENYREQIIEDKRELDFVNSFKNDLKNDISELDGLILRRKEREIQIDSIYFIFKYKKFNEYSNDLYFYARYLPRPSRFFANNASIDQLKNSGSLTLIKNQKVIDTLLGYNDNFLFIDYIREREEYLVQRIFDQINIIFDPYVFDQMTVYDIEFNKPKGSVSINYSDIQTNKTFLSNLQYLKTVNKAQLGWFIEHSKRAKNILNFLDITYNMN